MEAPMDRPAGTALLDHFAALQDPRQAAKVLHPLPEILLLLLGATLAGADDFVEIEMWGEEHLAFLRRFLPYRHGIPSHDTLGEVVAALDPELFKACFTSWVEVLREAAPDLVAIDGKTSRRTHARGKGRAPLHLISAWATRQRLVLGQEAVAGKSNETAAVPPLLERLERIARPSTDPAPRSAVGIALSPTGDERCRVPTPATCASGRSPPTRVARGASPRSRGSTGSGSARSPAGSRSPARRGAARRGRAAGARGRWAARPRRWPPWWRSGTTPPWPSTPTCWPSAPGSGAAPRRCAGR